VHVRAQIVTTSAVVVAAVAAYAAFTHPDATASPTSADLLNQDQVERITASPHGDLVALPMDLPPHLEFLQATRTESYGSEVHFQEAGVYAVVCRGAHDPDSACDGPSATVFRDETVGGERVRVAWIRDEEVELKGGQSPTDAVKADVEGFWEHAELALGTPPWLGNLGQPGT